MTEVLNQYCTIVILQQNGYIPQKYHIYLQNVSTGKSAGRMMFEWLMQHTDGFLFQRSEDIYWQISFDCPTSESASSNPLINDMLLILIGSLKATCKGSDTDKAVKKHYILSAITPVDSHQLVNCSLSNPI